MGINVQYRDDGDGLCARHIYAQAYRVMIFPLQSMTFVANRALFPV
jgi:hypothetical protein